MKNSSQRRPQLDSDTVSRLDALAKMLVVGFPIMPVVTYHRLKDRLTIDIWSQVDPNSPRTPQMRSSSTAAATCEDLDQFVRSAVADFLKETGPWFYRR
jgi:hypothetical protein